MGSLITREKGYVRTRKNTRGTHARTRVHRRLTFSPGSHCSLRLAHLHIRGSRTHYQRGEMKGAHGGRREKRGGRRVEGGGRRSGGKKKKKKRKTADAEAGSLTPAPTPPLPAAPFTPPHHRCVWTEFEFAPWLRANTAQTGYDGGHDLFILSY